MTHASGQTVPGVPLLETKLFIPSARASLVARPRLSDRLEQGVAGKLTLISAPAGFGKTTLLADWLSAFAAADPVVAWVSLDETDNDPTLFWSYVIAALQAVRPGIGETAMALLHSAQPPSIESILTTVINDIAALAHEVVLVLDDYHVIDVQPIHGALAFLLDHLPPRMNLIVASRSDPPLPLSRLRARGELTELRAADLRFTPDEAAAFLNRVMGLELSAADVAALETRTEGWIAGLQLAALSMRGRADVSGFIAAFTGDARYIVDYLAEEVLLRQPDHVRDFLLQTSLLDRLSGPLCDAVTGREDGRRMLDALDRDNLFVVPLDDERRWYRYHHLFADVLQAKFRDESPELVPAVHARASEWFARNGQSAEAIRHAFSAGDFERAANQIELTATAMRRNRQEATMLGWLRLLPDEVVHVRPVLSGVYGGMLLSSGELERVDDLLGNAERWLEIVAEVGDRPDPQTMDMVVVDHDEFRRLPGLIAVHRAGRALAVGDLERTVCFARRALEVVPEDEHLYRGAASAILGLVAWTSGDLESARQSYAEGMASLERAGYITDAIGGVVGLADIQIAQGRLNDAMSTYQRALQLAQGQGGLTLRGTADVHTGMSEILRERNQLDAAARHLATGADLGDAAGFPRYPYRWRAAMAGIRAAEGDLIGALELIEEAERVYVGDFHPNVRPLAAQKARLWIAQGKLQEALGWVRDQGLSASDELSYMREYEHITLARVLIVRSATGQDDRFPGEALELLDRLLTAAEEGERSGSVIEIHVLQALARQARGDVPSALASLECALILAEPEGYARIFIDEGEPMRGLLRRAVDRGGATAYARRLLSAFGVPAEANTAPVKATSELPEPLTAREIEVLRLIAAGMRNEEIADQLFISLATVKRHIANAYGKLGVSHRVKAISRAAELGLI